MHCRHAACLYNIKHQSDNGTGRILDYKPDHSHLVSKDYHVDRTADKMRRDLHLDQIHIGEDNYRTGMHVDD